MKQFKSYLLKEDIKDILLSDYKNKEMLLDEILDDEKELGTPVKEQQQLFEVINKLKSKLEEVQTTMEEESADYNPEFDAASYT